MGTLELDIALRNLEEELADGISALREREPDAGRVLELCAFFRRLGCGLLLAELDVNGFQHALYQSAHLYLWLLRQRDAQPALDTYYLCKSQARPLLDCLALGRFELALTIGQQMTSPWEPRMEPEEDYHYFDLLSGCLLEGREDEQKLALFERSMQGESSSRFEVIRALVRRDIPSFWAALSILRREWQEELEEERSSGSTAPYVDQTEAHVFVEGIALVRLAGLWGIPRQDRIALMPAEAFQDASQPFPPDLMP